MGHGKLRKFEENKSFGCLLQPESESVISRGGQGLSLIDHPVKGRWNETVFDSPRPIILELGCGKGEYTISLAERHPEYNYIGIDIKGARLWKGAKYATEHNMRNVAFLRTRIEFIEAFFGPGEVEGIWLTFSDPQLRRENARLTSPRFLGRYRSFIRPGGLLQLKTDSRFLYEYSRAVALQNGLEITASSTDIYGGEISGVDGTARKDLTEIRTYYEKMSLALGYEIKYLAFRMEHEGEFIYPEFDADYWRSIEGERNFGYTTVQ